MGLGKRSYGGGGKVCSPRLLSTAGNDNMSKGQGVIKFPIGVYKFLPRDAVINMNLLA